MSAPARFALDRPLLVITGPNAGGKTVALKTLGLLALMAQAGCHVPARAGARLPVFSQVFAIVGDDQSVAENLSTFSAFVKQLRDVLDADDERSVAESMGELLRTWGLEVDLAPGPEEALSMLGSDPGAYDLVITDQTMPRMSGLQLAGRIARLSPAPPVVLYTAYADDVLRHELEAARVKDLVRKPFELSELRAILEERSAEIVDATGAAELVELARVHDVELRDLQGDPRVGRLGPDIEEQRPFGPHGPRRRREEVHAVERHRLADARREGRHRVEQAADHPAHHPRGVAPAGRAAGARRRAP